MFTALGFCEISNNVDLTIILMQLYFDDCEEIKDLDPAAATTTIIIRTRTWTRTTSIY